MLAPTSATYVRIAAIDGLAEVLRAHQVALEPLLRSQGIDPSQLTQPESRISFRQLVGMLDAAAHATGDDCLGLHLGAAQSIHCSGVLGYATAASPDVRTQITLAGRYFGLHQESATVLLSASGGLATAVYETNDPQVTLHRQDAEMTLALFVAQVRLHTGLVAWAPTGVHFMHPEPQPASARELRRFFACPVHHGDRFNGLRFPEAFLDTPTRTSDPALLEILKRHAEDCLSRQAHVPAWCGRVRRMIASALSSGHVNIEDIAQTLAMTPRTLQRRLADEGKQFSDLVEDTRRDLAVQYLRDPRITLTDAAFLVGYSDLTAFHRAFKRWFNQTPLEYQRQLRTR